MDALKILLAVPETAQEQVAYLFREVPQVHVLAEKALDVEAQALIVPLNSFGFFDSGFPLEVTDRLGFGLQDELQTRIVEQHFGELLVGQAEVIPTGAATPRFVIAAPVARSSPGNLKDTINVYLATRAALLAIRENPDLGIESVAFPLEAVLEGGVNAYAAARQIRYGVRAVLRERPRRVQNLSKMVRRERDLKRLEKKSPG